MRTRVIMAHTPKLTQRERDILRLIMKGHTNREIAAALEISEQTVKNQLTVIFQKLGTKNRLEAAVWGMKHHP